MEKIVVTDVRCLNLSNLLIKAEQWHEKAIERKKRNTEIQIEEGVKSGNLRKQITMFQHYKIIFKLKKERDGALEN